jgi:hypothetical protein
MSPAAVGYAPGRLADALGGPLEADQAANQSVVAGMRGAGIVAGEQGVQPVFGLQDAKESVHHGSTEGTEAARRKTRVNGTLTKLLSRGSFRVLPCFRGEPRQPAGSPAEPSTSSAGRQAVRPSRDPRHTREGRETAVALDTERADRG